MASDDNTPRHTYAGIEIAYSLAKDRWEFELGGKERFASSLQKARDAIDAVPKQKRAGFERFKAYYFGWGGNGTERFVVEVTSLAEDTYRNGKYFWISNKGERSKVAMRELFALTPSNEAIFAEIESLEKNRKALEARIDAARKRRKTIAIPAGIVEENAA